MNRILVAYDGLPPARRALSAAIQLARAEGDASLGVVSVVPYHPGRDPEATRDDETDMNGALFEAVSILHEAGLEAEPVESWGDPAPTIERVADDGGYDTIVLGTRDLGPLARLFRGSVSKHVVDHAGKTVVVAR